VFWIETDRLVKVGDSLIEFALRLVRVAAVHEGEGAVRVEPDRHAVVGDRAVVVVLGPVSETAIDEGEGKILSAVFA
jgi:hypothetical protein